MRRVWSREVLRYVDAWACRDGTPEDDEDRRKGGVRMEAGSDESTELEELEHGREGGRGSGVLRRSDEAEERKK